MLGFSGCCLDYHDDDDDDDDGDDDDGGDDDGDDGDDDDSDDDGDDDVLGCFSSGRYRIPRRPVETAARAAARR